MKLNLTWWRKRPSVHVADRPAYTQIIDMNRAITMLDPGEDSLLNALMAKLWGTERLVVDWHPAHQIGDILRDSRGVCWRIIEKRRKDPDDWFSNEYEAVCDKPWGVSSKPPVSWLEDDIFPRTGPFAGV